MMCGLLERWWPLAIIMWAVMYNATFRGADGFTPWQRRYPFGDLALCKHPDDAPVPRIKNGSDKSITRKWRNRLVPAIVVGATTGPGGQWARSHQVVPLASILLELRSDLLINVRSLFHIQAFAL